MTEQQPQQQPPRRAPFDVQAFAQRVGASISENVNAHLTQVSGWLENVVQSHAATLAETQRGQDEANAARLARLDEATARSQSLAKGMGSEVAQITNRLGSAVQQHSASLADAARSHEQASASHLTTLGEATARAHGAVESLNRVASRASEAVEQAHATEKNLARLVSEFEAKASEYREQAEHLTKQVAQFERAKHEAETAQRDAERATAEAERIKADAEKALTMMQLQTQAAVDRATYEAEYKARRKAMIAELDAELDGQRNAFDARDEAIQSGLAHYYPDLRKNLAEVEEKYRESEGEQP